MAFSFMEEYKEDANMEDSDGEDDIPKEDIDITVLRLHA